MHSLLFHKFRQTTGAMFCARKTKIPKYRFPARSKSKSSQISVPKSSQIRRAPVQPYILHIFLHFPLHSMKLQLRKWSNFCRCSPLVSTPCPEKKRTNSILGITSSNTGQFTIFFYFYNLLEICNKAVVKYPIAPKTRHYTTL